MDILLLPGNSKNNKEWIDSVFGLVKSKFSNAYVIHYDHWSSEDGFIDYNTECKKIEKLGLHSPYLVFAKSIGTILTLESIKRGIIAPAGIIFCGTPLAHINECNSVLESLALNKTPIHFIQQAEDKVGGFSQLIEQLSAYKNDFMFTEIDGNDHKYSDLEFLAKAIEDMM